MKKKNDAEGFMWLMVIVGFGVASYVALVVLMEALARVCVQ